MRIDMKYVFRTLLIVGGDPAMAQLANRPPGPRRPSGGSNKVRTAA